MEIHTDLSKGGCPFYFYTKVNVTWQAGYSTVNC